MSTFRIMLGAAGAILACGLADWAGAAPDYDQTFLTDYSKLVGTPLPNNMGTDLVYLLPGALDRLAKYNSIMVDEPEVLISASSDYKGAKPTDLEAIATLVRTDVGDALKAGGYGVVDAPGPAVLYIKMAVTDLSLKKKKRRLLAYTPAGFIINAGVKAFQDLMEKYDVMGAAIQGQAADSSSTEVLAEFVALRGNNGKRMDFKDFDADIKSFASRLRCRLDNAHVPAAQQIDCLDPKARQAREASKGAPH
ncbi:MAG TPA: DUF3313 family protein [Steroidobacteraceae bacterium]|nr:DUF3313 family protein [Steroidobacteraceae bacterium]